MNIFTIPLIILATVALFFALWAMSCNREKSELAAQLKDARRELLEVTSQFTTLEQELAGMRDFQGSISRAKVTTKLQTSRLNKYEKESSAPEKYQYINNLSDKGMSSEEIASVLTISANEASQLVSLAKLAKKTALVG